MTADFIVRWEESLTIYECLVFGFIMLPLGLFFLVLGLRIKKRKPVLILPKTLGRGMALVFLPVLAVMAYRLSVESLNSESVMMSLAVSLLGLSILAGIYAVLIFFLTRSIWVFNVTEAILIEGWCEALQKHGIEYSLSQRTGLGAFPGLSRVIVSLPGLGSSIKVTLSTFGRAWVSIRGKRHIQNYNTLVSDFRCALAVKDYKGATAAFQFFFAAAGAIGLTIYGLFSVLLK